MDARRFDALTRSFTEPGSRRGLLAALPLLGGLFALLEAEEVAARKNRRKGRKKPHKRAKRHRKMQKQRKKKNRCRAHSGAKTCANRCGTVKNNCGRRVNCGPCVCDPICSVCQVCNETTGVCEPDPSQQGDDCGDPGQICQADGTCACDASSCAAGQHCETPVCVCDSSSCSGCCDEGTCQPGITIDACGTGGVECTPCTGSDTCQSGVCTCLSATCQAQGKNCGSIDDGCGGTDNCGDCPFPNQPCNDNVCGPCEPDCTGKACGADDGCGAPCLDGSCPKEDDTCGGGGTPGVCGCTPITTCPGGANCGAIDDGCGGQISCGGDSCGGDTPICVDNVCTACSAEHPCESGCCDGSGICGPCLVFITSTTHNGNLGGLTGADGICQNLADNAATPLPGTYKAWLSTGTGQSPANGRFHRSGQPYQLVNGTTVADDWDDLTSGSLNAAITITESGDALGSSTAWTATTDQGNSSSGPVDCTQWTSADAELLGGIGHTAQSGTTGWTEGASRACSTENVRLYCFQQA